MAKSGAVKQVHPEEETKAVQQVSKGELEAAKAANSNEIINSDILVPRLLLMQGISSLVTNRKAQIGDMVRSTTAEKLGNPEQPVDIVPIKMVNSWINFQVVGNKPEFRGMEERNASNEQAPWEFEAKGQQWIRRKAITLYALVPSDIEKYNQELKRAIEAGEAPDLNRTVLPVVVTFQSTSFKHAGKKCASFFNNVRVNAQRVPGLAPFKYLLPLTCREEKNQKGQFYVFDLGSPRALKDPAALQEAARWATILNTTKLKTDDTGEVMEEGSEAAGASEMDI